MGSGKEKGSRKRAELRTGTEGAGEEQKRSSYFCMWRHHGRKKAMGRAKGNGENGEHRK